MPYYVWPFVDYAGDNTWKTYYLEKSTENALPFQFWKFGSLNNGDPSSIILEATRDWPSLQEVKDFQFRLSSNFNSRSCRGPDPILNPLYPYDSDGKLYRKSRSCPILKFKVHEYQETGKFRTQRRWDFKTRKYVTEKVPILVRKIKLLPGRKIGSLSTNALWFEEKLRFCTVPNVQIFALNNSDTPPYQNFDILWNYLGPWCSISALPWPPYYIPAELRTFGNEFLLECLSGAPTVEFGEQIDLLDQKVIKKLYSKILNQKVDLATALAEGVKTYEMIINLASRMAQFCLAIARLKIGKAFSQFRKALKDLFPLTPTKMANDFLAVRYGMTPLVADLTGAALQIAAWFDSEPKIYARSRSRTVIDRNDAEAVEISDGFMRQEYNSQVTIDVVYKLTYTVKNLGHRRLEELGFTNPANVEWELVPFSFVIDWFLPIGNYLRDVGAASNLSVKECSRTVSIRKDKTVGYWHSTGVLGSGRLIVGAAFQWTVSELSVFREIIPMPDLPIPTFKNPFSFGHIANALALLVQLTKGFKP